MSYVVKSNNESQSVTDNMINTDPTLWIFRKTTIKINLLNNYSFTNGAIWLERYFLCCIFFYPGLCLRITWHSPLLLQASGKTEALLQVLQILWHLQLCQTVHHLLPWSHEKAKQILQQNMTKWCHLNLCAGFYIRQTLCWAIHSNTGLSFNFLLF